MALIGTTKIELTDVNTGEVETVEEHNMVTNALSEVFKVVPWLGKGVDSFANTGTYPNEYYKDLLGGLLLFDGAIEEDPETIYAPTSVNMVGNAVYGEANGGKSTTRGTYNTTESSFNAAEKTAKFVYDFSTDQANGTIACACLTNHDGAVIGYGSPNISPADGGYYTGAWSGKSCTPAKPAYVGSRSGLSGAYNYTTLLYADKDYMYMLDIQSGKDTFDIEKKPMLSETRSVFDAAYSYAMRTSWAGDVKDLEGMPVLSRNCFCNTDAKNKRAYYTKGSMVYEIDLEAEKCTQYDLTPTASTIGSLNAISYIMVYDGYMYAYYDSAIYKVNLHNMADITRLSGTFSGDNCALKNALYVNGWIFSGYKSNNSNYCYNIINTQKNTVQVSEARIYYCESLLCWNGYEPCVQWMLSDCKVARIGAYYANNGNLSNNARLGSVALVPMYLATINNLSSPVVKTADKTMKITYTIREE